MLHKPVLVSIYEILIRINKISSFHHSFFDECDFPGKITNEFFELVFLIYIVKNH